MTLMDKLKDENLGCILLYNFTLGYQQPVPMAVYDYVLPLLFNETFQKNCLTSLSYEECISKSIAQTPALFDCIREQFDELKNLTSRTLGLAVVQQMIAFEVHDNEVCGSCLPSTVLDFNEAIQLGKWFSQMTTAEIMRSFNYYAKKIVILDGDTLGDDIDLSIFNQLGLVSLYPATSASEVVERIKDASYVMVNKVILDEKVLAQAEQLEYIGLFATGTNNIDLDYCKQHKITVKNVSGYSSDVVAQHTFSLLLYLYEKMAYYDQYVKSGDYCKSSSFSHFAMPFNELAGKTWGIIGLGQIGRKVATIAEAFGCRVVYYSTSGKNNDSTYQQVTFEELLGMSDIVSIHAPLNEQTYHLFDNHAFAHMKRNAYLINVGRGPIIDEEALAFALKHHLILGAGLDVLEVEPMSANNPLLALCDSTHLVITPHSAWAAVETRIRLVQFAYNTLKEYIVGNAE